MSYHTKRVTRWRKAMIYRSKPLFFYKYVLGCMDYQVVHVGSSFILKEDMVSNKALFKSVEIP